MAKCAQRTANCQSFVIIQRSREIITAQCGVASSIALLLITLPIMFYPTCDVVSTSITVSPVDQATAFIPLVLAKERHSVAAIQTINTGRHVNVVGHQQGLSGFEFQNKSLVPAAAVVVSKQASHPAASLDLERRLALTYRPVKLRVCRL